MHVKKSYKVTIFRVEFDDGHPLAYDTEDVIAEYLRHDLNLAEAHLFMKEKSDLHLGVSHGALCVITGDYKRLPVGYYDKKRVMYHEAVSSVPALEPVASTEPDRLALA